MTDLTDFEAWAIHDREQTIERPLDDDERDGFVWELRNCQGSYGVERLKLQWRIQVLHSELVGRARSRWLRWLGGAR